MKSPWRIALLSGSGLAFLLSAGPWLVIAWATSRDLPLVAELALLTPIAAFALLGSVLRGPGVLGALMGGVLAAALVLRVAGWVAPSMSEAQADSMGWGIPIELAVFMLPAALLGWAVGVTTSWVWRAVRSRGQAKDPAAPG